MTQPTILILSAFYDPWMSGAERFVEETVARLKGRYYFIIYTSRLSRRVPAREQREGYEIRRLGFGVSWDKWLFPLLVVWSARRSDALVAHAVMESYAGIALLFLGWLRPQVKRVLTLQSGDLDDQRKQKWIPQGLWRAIHRSPHIVTAISRALAERAHRLGVPKERVRIIPNGVEVTTLAALQTTQPVAHRIVTVARLSWEKGLDVLLQALTLVRAQIADVSLVIVGDGPLRASLEQQVDRLGLRAAVTLRGKLPHKEALQEIALGELFVCPSLAEGLGIVFLEAQALGVPVIGTRVGGIPDVIEDGVTGLLVAPQDAPALAQAMTRLLEDRTLAKPLVDRATTRLQRFDWSVIADEMDQVYRSLLV